MVRTASITRPRGASHAADTANPRAPPSEVRLDETREAGRRGTGPPTAVTPPATTGVAAEVPVPGAPVIKTTRVGQTGGSFASPPGVRDKVAAAVPYQVTSRLQKMEEVAPSVAGTRVAVGPVDESRRAPPPRRAELIRGTP